jgi:predicted alpha/beta-fold hydrolase
MHVTLPQFSPHPLVRGGHTQTVVASFLPGTKPYAYSAAQHRITLDDGDQIVLHDDIPATWQSGDRVALLVHGLGGSHRSGYMVRGAAKLVSQGVRVFRMDLRGWGAGFGLNRLPLHAGRSEDARQAFDYIADICPDAPINVVGFSMGANMVLKMAGEFGDSPPSLLAGVMGVSPPICLQSCMTGMRQSFWNRFYDRNFVRWLQRYHVSRKPLFPEEQVPADFPPGLLEYDALITAPQSGFVDAADYYNRASAGPMLSRIGVPALVVAAADDPIIPIANFQQASYSATTQVEITSGGGHLGFIGTSSRDPDRRWIDWRVVDWVLTHGQRPTIRHRPHSEARMPRKQSPADVST